MSDKTFENIRELGAVMGIAMPESDEELFSSALFNTMIRCFKRHVDISVQMYSILERAKNAAENDHSAGSDFIEEIDDILVRFRNNM